MSNVGRSVPRTDGADKVTGHAIYVDDLSFPGMLHGATIRTTEPCGRLDEIVWDPAFDWSGITRVDASDIPGENAIYLMDTDQPALVEGHFKHAEEPVALIAAEDKETLRRAKGHVTLRTTPGDPLFDPAAALRLESVIYGKDNVFKKIDMKKGDAAAALARAPHVIEAQYHTGYHEQMYIETQGIIAVPDPDGGVTIYGSLQCPYYVIKALSPLLELPKEKVRVIQCVTGGGFGGKEEYPSMIAGHAALLALKAGRPVKIIYDRTEDIAATTKRHPCVVTHRTGYDDDGRLIAMHVDVLMDGGAYLTLSPVVLSRAAIHACGPYRCDDILVEAVVVATNTPPNGAFRGFGAPQVCFPVERQMDRLAAALGISPLEIRQRNLLRLGDITATGQTLEDSVGSEAVLSTTIERSDYQRRWEAARDQPPDARFRRGVGLSCMLHGAGFTGNGEVRLAGKLDMETSSDGGVRILTGSTDIGQGTRTIFPQIAADALGLPMEQVAMAEPDTADVPDSGPTVASRTCMVVGRLVEDACHSLANALALDLASQLGLEPDAVRFEGGQFVWEGGSRPFSAAAADYHNRMGGLRVRAEYENRDQLEWDEATYTGAAYPCYAWAAVVTEVEVDMDTYIPRIVRFVTAQDIGKAIHPIMAAGQIEGGSLQALGWASMEEVRMKDGRYQNHRMTDCIIPTALDAPEMEVDILEFPYKFGPHGAKGVGELPMDLPAPAVAAAMEQATGVIVDAVPFTPEMLCERLSSTGGAS